MHKDEIYCPTPKRKFRLSEPVVDVIRTSCSRHTCQSDMQLLFSVAPSHRLAPLVRSEERGGSVLGVALGLEDWE